MAKRASSNIRNGKSTPRYNEEFKRDAVALWHTSGRSIVSVARELGISDVTLGTWIKKAKRAGAQPLTAEEEADKKEEIRLRKRVRELETELDILKRFTSYWVRETAP